MEFNLENVLKSFLLSTSEPLTLKEIQSTFGRYHEQLEEDEQEGSSDIPTMITTSEIRETIEKINVSLASSKEPYAIHETPEGYQIAITPEYSAWIRLLRGEPRPLKLSRALMETLTIIAYQQPVTRAEIESIRGVSADNAVSKLIEHGLIEFIGRADLPGRPMQYATTEGFLEFCGIHNLSELPESDILSQEQIESWVHGPAETEVVSDNEVGLPSESSEEAAVTLNIAAPAETQEAGEADDVAPASEAVSAQTPEAQVPELTEV